MKTEAGWYAVDMNFGFYRFRDADGVVKTGAQCAMVSAVFERRIVELERFRLSKEPSALDAETIFGLLDGIFSNFGKPDVGIMFMPGVWMATGDLEKRTVSRKRVRALVEKGVAIPAMTRIERMMIEVRLRAMGLDCLWSGDPP